MEPLRLTLHPNGPLEISGAIAIVRADAPRRRRRDT